MIDLSLLDNPILNVDSYAFSHFKLYPKNTGYTFSYIESRGGEFDATLFVGLQAYIKRYLLRRITHQDVTEAAEIVRAHGLPFNEAAFRIIVDEHGGRWPLRIRAVREGTVLTKRNVMVTIENTDPRFPWLSSFFEAPILRAVWYPTTVATTSYQVKRILRQKLLESSDLNGEAFETKLNFMLHDFGARGASSKETAELGGTGHLVNFMGTDTVGALLSARVFYHEHMAGYSIAASQHSTVTAWGRDKELDFYRYQLHECGGEGRMFASVIDSYDQYRAVTDLWGGALKDELIASGATVVLRPDSGKPVKYMPDLLDRAGAAFGCTVNSKSRRVLPSYVRFISGEGNNLITIPGVADAVIDAGWSIENMALGMGGGLLQDCTRDDHQFAQKMSAIYQFETGQPWTDHGTGGSWHDVWKDPIDDPGKRSKRGRLGLYRDATGADVTGPLGQPGDRLETVYDGELARDQTFAEIRLLAA